MRGCSFAFPLQLSVTSCSPCRQGGANRADMMQKQHEERWGDVKTDDVKLINLYFTDVEKGAE